MTRKRMIIGVFSSTLLFLAIPGQASAAVCVNGVNASVLGDAEQENDCETNVGIQAAPTAP